MKTVKDQINVYVRNLSMKQISDRVFWKIKDYILDKTIEMVNIQISDRVYRGIWEIVWEGVNKSKSN